MLKINTALVQAGEKEDKILKSPCFKVNIRLLYHNKSYFNIISNIIQHMLEILNTKFSDYTKLQGISGANVGIPFNIIIVRDLDNYIIMINPEILSKSKETKLVKSNCGSLNLKKQINVRRHIEVLVRYIPFDGKNISSPVEKIFKSTTIQHEIEHNLGILITDKEEKNVI